MTTPPTSPDAGPELSDREVHERLARAIGLRAPCADEWLDESEFAGRVIPTLDARGLGDKYADALAEAVRASGVRIELLWNNELQWRLLSAPLSLRARTALAVLENANA